MNPTGADFAELRALTERSRGLLEELRGKATEATDQRRKTLDSFGNDATQLIEEISDQLATELATDLAVQHSQELADEYQRLAEEREALDAERSAFTDQTEQLVAERTAFESDREASQTERNAWQEEREEWESIRTEVEAELAVREEGIERRAVEVEDQLVSDERQTSAKSEQAFAEVTEQAATAEQQVLEATERSEQLFSEVEQLTTALADACAQLESSQQTTVELTDLQEKFDIALQDLQAHREQVALLDEELAARPETNDAEGAELAQLRQERDELAAQVENILEEARSESGSADESNELADLRVRFEMVIDDLRQLKTENADLQERLSKNPVSSANETEDGNDWESQKRRLLALLEGEEEPTDSQRQAERTSIADTIQITDTVVAEKDQEIEQLRSQLVDNVYEGAERVVSDEEAALLDEDAIVQAERERLAELEKEWEEKVRTAELEISLERAKLSRAQNEIAKLKIEFETQQGSGAEGLGAAATQARHNWINKLGLGNEAD